MSVLIRIGICVGLLNCSLSSLSNLTLYLIMTNHGSSTTTMSIQHRQTRQGHRDPVTPFIIAPGPFLLIFPCKDHKSSSVVLDQDILLNYLLTQLSR